MKRWSLFLLITLVAISASTPTEAANWDGVVDAIQYIAYVDTESITEGVDGSKEAWVKYESKTPDCVSETAKLKNSCVVSLVRYHRYFKNKSSCTLQAVANYSDGKTLSLNYVCEPKRNVSGSVGELIWDYLNLKATINE